jgi:23S rRNA (pseudouridine1915-N3)-methyltransferase
VTIRILFAGKVRDAHANAIVAEYVKRCTRFARCEMREVPARGSDPLQAYRTAMKVLLDPAGRTFDSAAFTELVRRTELDARDLVFLLGGADGLRIEWKEKADLLLSLSPLTFPHELARAILAEQVYRALTTLRGHPYPR